MSSSADATKPYRIIGTPQPETRWEPSLETTVRGTVVRAQWLATGWPIVVFVPDTADLVTTADSLIRFQGAQLDGLKKLSG